MKPNFAFNQWFMPMECRKDILIQNEFINKKNRRKVTSRWDRLKTSATNNKMRIAYFFGFCLLFSMERLYDILIYENRYLKKIQNKLSSWQRIPSIDEQYRLRTKISSEKTKQLVNLFMKVDESAPVTGQLINYLKGGNYEKDYVDAVEFVNELKNENLNEIQTKIKSKFPYLLI